MGAPPALGDPKGIVLKLRTGEIPFAAQRWFLTGHDGFLEEIEDRLSRVTQGVAVMALQFIEGVPGSGKTTLLRLIQEIAFEKDFATCWLEVTSKGGQFTESRLLVASVIRGIRVRTSTGMGDWDAVLKGFASRLLAEFPNVEDETWDTRTERLWGFITDRLSKYELPEKGVVDAVGSYVYAYEQQQPNRMRRIVEWFCGEPLSPSDLRNMVQAPARMDEKTALPLLRSVIPIMVEAGYPGLVLLVDEMVQFTHEHHESQRQRTQDLVRSLYSGAVPRCLIFVGATPETISDTVRGLRAHPGLHSRLGDHDVPNRDPESPRYIVNHLSKEEAAAVLRKLRSVYREAYGLRPNWLDGEEAGILKAACPGDSVLARDFVIGAIRAMDAVRRPAR